MVNEKVCAMFVDHVLNRLVVNYILLLFCKYLYNTEENEIYPITYIQIGYQKPLMSVAFTELIQITSF